MNALRRTLDPRELLPESIVEAIGRRLRELAGIALVAVVAAALLALVTWSVKDPSLSHATGAAPRNLLGYPGAVIADLLMQVFGLSALVAIAPVAMLGWRMIHHQRLGRRGLRILLWLSASSLAAGFAGCLPRTAKWPLPNGLGGLLGDQILRLPAWTLGGPLGGTMRVVVAVILGMAAIAAFMGAVGLLIKPREDEPDAAISIGWIVHQILSLKARLTRLVFLPVTLWRSLTTTAPAARIEPGLERRRIAVAREVDEEDGEDEEMDGEAENEIEDAGVPVTRAKAKIAKPARAARRTSDGFVMPSLNLLAAPRATDRFAPSVEAIQENATALESVLQDFGVRGEIINARPGPVVTLYELEPAPGIKSSRVIGLSDDIARSMSALSARVAVVSGRNAIGIELPNATREKVYLRELLAADDYNNSAAKLPLCLGKSIGGEPVIVDLSRMPHLLIAGTTGSGKSVAINTMILSLVYRLTPDQCRLIMVDPKMLELSVYDGIPHLLTPVVTDPKKAVVALKWAVREMEDRYKKMSKLGVRNIDGYNARVTDAIERGETLMRRVHTGYDKESGEAIYEKEEFDLEPLPFIVVIVDEMADLMMVAGKDIEGAIQRLAQMARAAGIHVILATQRPSVDVITGTIKANFPTRISFQVTSKIDSRTILGEQGAEQLLGQGDMLYMAGGGRISRVHGPFVSDEEVEKIVRHLKTQGIPQYLEEVTAEDLAEEADGAVFDSTGMGQSEGTDLYSQAVQIVMRDQKASTSYIQRRLQIGYNRAASIMERMEQEGIVGQPNHGGKREILVGGGEDERY